MHKYLPVALSALMMCVPTAVYAATFSVVPSAATTGQEFSVQVHFAPEGEHLNAVEGNLRIPEGLSVTRISVGGSALQLWTVSPSYSRSSHQVSFAGGVAGANLPGTNPLLFTVYLTAATHGSYTLSPEGLFAFRADGTGTRIAVSAAPVPVTVGSDSLAKEKNVDNTAPDALVAVLGSDVSLFDGAPFVSFYGTDADAGIVSYKAKEGWFGRYELVDRYYIPKHNPTQTPLWIRATDGAGNERSVHVPTTGGWQYYVLPALPIVLCLLFLLLYISYRRL